MRQGEVVRKRGWGGEGGFGREACIEEFFPLYFAVSSMFGRIIGGGPRGYQRYIFLICTSDLLSPTICLPLAIPRPPFFFRLFFAGATYMYTII